MVDALMAQNLTRTCGLMVCRFWEPDYDEPVFLAKLDRYLAAMAARYDGNPEIAFVAGVAPCLPAGFPAFTFKDRQGGIVGAFVDQSLDVRTLRVAEPGKQAGRGSGATGT